MLTRAFRIECTQLTTVASPWAMGSARIVGFLPHCVASCTGSKGHARLAHHSVD